MALNQVIEQVLHLVNWRVRRILPDYSTGSRDLLNHVITLDLVLFRLCQKFNPLQLSKIRFGKANAFCNATGRSCVIDSPDLLARKISAQHVTQYSTRPS